MAYSQIIKRIFHAGNVSGITGRARFLPGYLLTLLSVPFNLLCHRKTLVRVLVSAMAAPVSFIQGQELTTKYLQETFNAYAGSRLQEKIYVHTDRDLYLAGEILWCKLYVVDGTLHQPLDLSKIAYVELLDENNLPALQVKLEVGGGKGNGSLFIPVTLRSGNYKLRAYTNWMKNAGADYFFEKGITIINTQKERDIRKSAGTAIPDIQFFPEGGNLVEGLKSVVACKVTSPDGNGMSFTGSILDEQGNRLAAFSSLHFGMGNFECQPAPGHSYHAVIETDHGRYEKPLPEIFPKGYVMTLNKDNPSALTVSVRTNAEEAGTIFLLVHTRQSLKTVLQEPLRSGAATFTIARDQLGDGISQFTVFSSKGKPVCERLYFTYPRRPMQIGIDDNQGEYATRSYVHLNVKPAIGGGQGIGADMSVSVYKLDELHPLSGSDIRSGLLLNSDIRGAVESPSYYFDNDPAATAPVMDLLMLTQGWRRFRWNDVLEHTAPRIRYAPEASGHIVSGRVTSGITGKPLGDVEVYLSAPGFNTSVRSSISDSAGRLKFDFKAVPGTSELIAMPGPNSDTTARIEIATPFSDEFSSRRLPPFRLPAKNEALLRSLSVGVQAQNAYYGSRLKHFLQYASDTLSSTFAAANATYYLDDYTRFTTMEEVLREYVTMINVQKPKGKFTVTVINDFPVPGSDLAKKEFFHTQPLMLVDAVPVFNTDRLMGFDPLKIRKLEVFNRLYDLGDSYATGIMNFTTYKGDYAGLELDPRALVIDYEGTARDREFYSPVYTPGQDPGHMPDFRTLLYWSHDIPVNQKGEYAISFYTSDVKGRYAAVVQGLTADGRPGAGTVFFDVK